MMRRSFFFYRNYLLDMANFLTEKQIREYLPAIIQYGVTGVYSISDPYLMPIFIQHKASIDSSIARYKRAVNNGKKGGRKKLLDRESILSALEKGVKPNYKELASYFGCCEKTVSRSFSKKEIMQLYELAQSI